MNPLIQSFEASERYPSLRSNQIECLSKVYSLLEAGNTLIEIEAPPGSGKSLIADSIMNYFNSIGKRSLVVSPLNDQVDQYMNGGFKNLATLKGREHYMCLASAPSCAEGYCKLKMCPDRKERNCKAQEYSYCRDCVCKRCIYKSAFNWFRKAKKANTNFSLLMLGINNDHDVLIIDESDTIEDAIRRQLSFTLPGLFKSYAFPALEKELLETKDKIVPELLKMDHASHDIKVKRQIEKLETNLINIDRLLSDFREHNEQWCVTVNRQLNKTKFEPVTIDRFLKQVLRNKIVIMMSATPNHYPGFQLVQVDSVFPIASRTWYYDPFPGSMTMRQRDASIPRLAVWLSWLKGKTIVHCKSYSTAQKIAIAMRKFNRTTLLQVNDDSDPSEKSYSRYDAIKSFLDSKDPDAILLSVNFTRGLDLHQPEIVHNVIAVVPWVNPTDPLSKMKTQIRGEAWKNKAMADEIAQAIARHFRNEKPGVYKGFLVPKQAHIVDASFGNWYRKNKGLFPKNFTESEGATK